jgi:Ca2+-binding RTX toxin-like protein
VGGGNLDTLDYGGATGAIEINLASGKGYGEDIGVDTFSSIERFNLGSGDDLVDGSSGSDEIHANNGDDIVYGEDGNDIVYGGAGDDFLFGDRGNDELHDGTGADTIDAGEGDDIVIAALDGSDDTFDGGDGEDTVSYSDSKMGVIFDIAGESATGVGIGSDQVSGFEVFRGGFGNDLFIAAGGEIAAADQSFEGGAGTDTLDYGDAAESIELDIGTGVAAGDDIGVDVFEGVERIVSGAGDDHIIFGNTNVTVAGGFGDDIFEMSNDIPLGGRQVRHVIEDFEVGDRVRMSLYDIFEQVVEDGSAPRMGMSDQLLDSQVPIRFHASLDGTNTFIDADFDNDNNYEITIELVGVHHLILDLNQNA